MAGKSKLLDSQILKELYEEVIKLKETEENITEQMRVQVNTLIDPDVLKSVNDNHGDIIEQLLEGKQKIESMMIDFGKVVNYLESRLESAVYIKKGGNSNEKFKEMIKEQQIKELKR